MTESQETGGGLQDIRLRLSTLEELQLQLSQVNQEQSTLIAQLSQEKQAAIDTAVVAKGRENFAQRLMTILVLTILLGFMSIDPKTTKASKEGFELGLREVPVWMAGAYLFCVVIVLLNQEQTDRALAVMGGVKGLLPGAGGASSSQ
jgi:preprotein translocase subunit SecG